MTIPTTEEFLKFSQNAYHSLLPIHELQDWEIAADETGPMRMNLEVISALIKRDCRRPTASI